MNKGRCTIGKSKAPKAPDPKETAAASTGTNIGTAVANSWLNNMNQVTPDGTLTYSNNGYETYRDPYTGQTYQIPKTTVTQTLSQQQQAIKDQEDGASLNLATLGNSLSGTLGQQLTGNFKIGNEDTEARLYELGSKRLDPQFARQEEALRSRLLNSGIREGSAAWNSEMERFSQGQNDAYNQLLLQGRGQATQEQLAEDNQRINQISALLSGGQVTQPNFMNTPTSPIPTTDVAGIINTNYQQQLAAHQANNQNILGGLFSLGASALSNPALKLSDRRTKEDIEKVGETEDGLGLYSFHYKGEPVETPKQIGLMAQDVKKKKPGAVVTGRGGLMMVDYDKALGLMGKK